MCVSAEVSFGMAGLLVAGGVFAVQEARRLDVRYAALAMFPVLVGIQQFAEGIVWFGAEAENPDLTRAAALAYLFFTWMIWPVWVPYMTAQLENAEWKRKLFLHFASAGLALGVMLYLPNFWHADWLNVQIINHSIGYQCTYITEIFFPRAVPYLLYLALIGLPPLLSSHASLKIFGAGLLAAVPLTYLLFSYAGVSVLCFFAAVMTLYVIYIILENKCGVLIIKPS